MIEKNTALYTAAKARFDYYGVKPDEKVLIVADSGTYEPLTNAVHKAAVTTGADVTLMTIKARRQPYNWEIPALLEHAIYNADFTFSLLHPMWYYNASSMRVQGHMHKTGKRICLLYTSPSPRD